MKKILSIILTISIIIGTTTISLAEENKVSQLNNINLKNVNIELLNNRYKTIPDEVKKAIKKYQNDKNVESIYLNESEIRTRVFQERSTRGSCNPYTGYKNYKFKDWTIKIKSTSDIVTIDEDKWGTMKNKAFSSTIKADACLLIGAISVKAGIAYTLIDIVASSLPPTIYSSTVVKHKVELIKNRKIEKYTYVKQADGQYMLGARTESIDYRFQHFITNLGEGTVADGYTEYEHIETQYFQNPDRRAWKSTYNPWVEYIGIIEYADINFRA